MSRYAEGTSVSVEKSRAEIETTLTRYGATAFAYAWEGSRAVVQFQARERRIRFDLPLPERNDERFRLTAHKNSWARKERSPEAARAAWEQACRQSWRALALVIKAKLEAVEAGITEFENEFLANIVLPDGKTVAQHVRPEVAIAYQSGKMQAMLPDYSKGN
jgi:hypothetical protein